MSKQTFNKHKFTSIATGIYELTESLNIIPLYFFYYSIIPITLVFTSAVFLP